MNTYVTFTRKKLLVWLTTLVCAALICSEVYVAGNNNANATTNAERLNFIKSMGYTVKDSEPTAKYVTVPDVFSDVYNNYNTLQLQSGYDLSLYKGCTITIYTYTINPPSNYDGDCVVNIMVYDNRVIGGDVSSRALGGFMLPLGGS